ncbi:rhodanese-like domain-containing protein [Gordonia sp. PP30]|uniref:rhodanese-like domain-containing protein n=1 Tax=unclassified Gordonia (in: high G+C Gram-positive bacteria) TaxID=2657482 RepID=UPI0020005A32|nr:MULTISPECIES: rhodanese-like domain-containing protein [unclassified Gordonia (in: high G+C Gram-positive bacteria)]UQE75552.1 rhodanese-like domain-containing protein [Gordonia sp. PP30]
MTLAIDVPVTTSVAPLAVPPAPLSVQVEQYRSALDAGIRVVDLRPAESRRTHGALLGALALDLSEALALLTPGTPSSLRSASYDAQWLLVTDDGYDAEFLAWHLQARGIRGARFLVGGHRALRDAGIGGTDTSDAHRFFS